jgi:K+-transporting ATPase ATPase A chain
MNDLATALAPAPTLAITGSDVLQLVIYLALLLALVKPLGWFITRVLEGKAGEAPLGLGRALGGLERGIYALCGVRTDVEKRPVETGWKIYAVGILIFNALGFIAVYALQRLQHVLPANPAGLGVVEAKSAFNTAVSFATNTNWQGYGGETTMSYLTQLLGLGVQNFLSAATGIAVLAALIRGLARKSSSTIGNCWADLTRVTLYILLPLSSVLAVALVSQGVVQTFREPARVALTVPLSYSEPVKNNAGETLKNPDGSERSKAAVVTEQVIPLGPAASQVAIKQLGTNGGGFFNVNSAHPLENPTALSNFLQMLAILLIPAALCWTFGEMVRDGRQGQAVLAAMMAIFVPLLAATYIFETRGNPAVASILNSTARDTTNLVSSSPHGGEAPNMEGKELRFGVANSALWAAATTAASNGSVNAMHDSFTPLGGLVPMWLMQLGEVVFGGVGSGLYGMLMFVIVAVFVAGLMVGRAPEYLGKKIEPFEMKMAMVCVLVPCAIVLVGTAVAVLVPEGNTTSNPGPHGFSQILYAFSSAGNNNGSAFAGLTTNTPFYNVVLGLAMWFSRFWIIVPVLAIAGSLAAKPVSPTTSGTLPTHTPVFVLMLVAVVVIVGALTFVPALALGPVVEHLQFIGR